MKTKEFFLSVEFYTEGNEEEPAVIQGNMFHLVSGVKIAIISSTDEEVVEKAKTQLKQILEMPVEYLSRVFPKFYKISLTKQYWFHVMEKDFIAKNQIEQEKDESHEVSLEDNLSTSLNDESPVLNLVDCFLDRDMNELNGPPERINFWEQMGLDDIGVEL